jgi:hypothetical protein
MRMRGTIVKKVSIGALYRNCEGNPESIERRRYAIAAHKIRTQVIAPTINNTIHEVDHSPMIRDVWFVTPASEGSHPRSSWAVQPESVRARVVPTIAAIQRKRCVDT